MFAILDIAPSFHDTRTSGNTPNYVYTQRRRHLQVDRNQTCRSMAASASAIAFAYCLCVGGGELLLEKVDYVVSLPIVNANDLVLLVLVIRDHDQLWCLSPFVHDFEVTIVLCFGLDEVFNFRERLQLGGERRRGVELGREWGTRGGRWEVRGRGGGDGRGGGREGGEGTAKGERTSQ